MNDQELLRYSRQIMLPQFDIGGQEKLLDARVLVIGLGGLGSPAAMYLASSGVGTLLLADDDKVDLSNLQRQIAHNSDSVGKMKTDSAVESLRRLNPEINIETFPFRLQGEKLRELLINCDLVLDCTDSYASRIEINAAARQAKIPVVSGSAIRMEGQVTVFDFRDSQSPCYQCLYHEAHSVSLNCSENGVLAPLVGIIGAVQALEAIKVLTGVGDILKGRLLLLDAMNMQWREMKLARNSHCPECGD